MYRHLLETLRATGIPFAEIAWENAPEAGSYGAIQLEGAADTVWADGTCREQALEGSIDLFVRNKSLTDMMLVQTALTDAGVSWRLSDVSFEPARRLEHYEWVFQIERA